MVKVLVMFATQTGNSRGVAKDVTDQAAERGHQARLLDMTNFKTVDFADEEVVVVVASSTGNGDCPDNGDKFYRYCKRKTTPQFLAERHFAICALGDSNYDAFCEVGKVFDQQFARLGGQRLLKRCDVDEVEGIETFVEPWMEKLWVALDSLTGGAVAKTPSTTAVVVDAPSEAAEGHRPVSAAPEAPEAPTGANDKNAPADAEPRGTFERPIAAPVVAARWLTSGDGGDKALGSEGARKVLHVELDVRAADCAASQFLPGDAIGLFPRNAPSEVDALLPLLSAGDGAAALPAFRGGDVPTHLAGCASVREALEARLDIGSVSVWPSLPLLKLLAAHTPSASAASGASAEGSALASQLATATGRGPDARAAHVAIQRARPSLVALLSGLKSTPPLAELLDALPPLAPRYYSIANAAAADPGRVHLCVSLVHYFAKAADGTRREVRGLASAMIADTCAPLLGGGAAGGGGGGAAAAPPALPIFFREATGNELRLPSEPSVPIVLIGPGTGLAPFRAFWQQRKVGWTRKQLGPCHVFFGCRAPDSDFLYSEELTALGAGGAITLHTAFSRSKKLSASGSYRGARVNITYVQDLIDDHADELCDLLFKKGGHINVCGDGQAMAADVHAALRRAVMANLCVGSEEAEKKLSQLMDDGRYCREIWN